MMSLWNLVFCSSVFFAAMAAALRELFDDAHIHWAARLLGFSSWAFIASFGWFSTQEYMRLEQAVMVQKARGVDDVRVVRISESAELFTPAGHRVRFDRYDGSGVHATLSPVPRPTGGTGATTRRFAGEHGRHSEAVDGLPTWAQFGRRL